MQKKKNIIIFFILNIYLYLNIIYVIFNKIKNINIFISLFII